MIGILVLHNVHSLCRSLCHNLGRIPDRIPCSSLLRTDAMSRCFQKQEKKESYLCTKQLNSSAIRPRGTNKHSLCGTTHVNSRSGGVGSFRNGIIYPDPTTIKLHPICMLLGLKMK